MLPIKRPSRSVSCQTVSASADVTITSTLSLGELRSERADCCSTHQMKGPPWIGAISSRSRCHPARSKDHRDLHGLAILFERRRARSPASGRDFDRPSRRATTHIKPNPFPPNISTPPPLSPRRLPYPPK